MNKVEVSRDVFMIVMDQARITNGEFTRINSSKMADEELKKRRVKELADFRRRIISKIARQPYQVSNTEFDKVLDYVGLWYYKLSREARMWLNPSINNDYDCNLMILIRKCIFTQGVK